MSLEGLDLKALEAHLSGRGLLPAGGQLRAEVLSGGRSNLTFALTSGSESWVLRRPPLGHVLATAHDMSREFRVLSALRGSEVPVPGVVAMCEDPDVIGAPFYVMEYVAGDALASREQLAALPLEVQSVLGHRLAGLLGRLHSVDHESLGLGTFGRPDGYLDRQLSRWERQLGASRSRELAGVEGLHEQLCASKPTSGRPALLHGDYRLDNCLVDDGRIAAVIDWEMATLGDPLADLGMAYLYYQGLSDLPNEVVTSPVGVGAFPRWDDVLETYVSVSGRDVAHADWYVAFAWFKFAVILEGIHYRSVSGLAREDSYAGVAELVQPSIDRGIETLAGRPL